MKEPVAKKAKEEELESLKSRKKAAAPGNDVRNKDRSTTSDETFTKTGREQDHLLRQGIACRHLFNLLQ
ncbi:hypothetical protein JCM5353_003190, partial [Sporobolomyces roseus]